MGVALISQVNRIRSQLLVLRYRRGDREAFKELVALWEKPLFYYIRRLVKTEEDAWDILQDTWIRVIRGIGKLKNLESLPVWLYRIARNTTYNYIRKNQKMEPFSYEEKNLAREESGVDQSFSAADAEAIHWGLQRLSLAQKEVLTFFFLEEFSLKEICSITGLPLGTVKSRLYYAKRALQDILEKEGLGYE
jgi:RNA polymerase sigma-70 factor (ECF subfamily)